MNSNINMADYKIKNYRKSIIILKYQNFKSHKIINLQNNGDWKNNE